MSSTEQQPKPDFVIHFKGDSLAEAAAQARALRKTLLDSVAGVEVKLTKDSNETMDLGSILEIFIAVGGSAVLQEIAKGIAARLSRNRSARLEMKADGTLIVEGSPRDAAALAEAMQKVLSHRVRRPDDIEGGGE